MLAALPFGATEHDTAEFLLGRVAVTVVFMESARGSAEDLYDWTPGHIEEVKERIVTGLEWWTDVLAGITDKHTLEFVYDFTHADTPFETPYEPIARKSIDYSLWVPEFLNGVGAATTGNLALDIRTFNHSQRVEHETDWSFTIFIANAEQDSDGRFEACGPGEGGCFRNAFAFAGGLFYVSPSVRPASTHAHEFGHIFWAFDEYPGGSTYTDQRGYYATQNLNAADNPAPGFQHQASIMSAGSMLQQAFDTKTSPASTLAMLGWQDSNGNGVFDVLDVPHTLTGTGHLDATAGVYRFLGHSSVQTLPNRNPSGAQNDITINRISEAQYRINGGPWQTAAQYGTYQADLDLSIPVSPGTHQIEIRTIDATTGVTSPVFVGTTAKATATTRPGINGLVWNDADANGVWNGDESGLAGWTVRLVDANGQPITLGGGVEPDAFASEQVLNTATAGVTLSAVGSGAAGADVRARTSAWSSTGNHVFGVQSSNAGWTNGWTGSRQLRVGFASPTSRVAIDAVADRNGVFGRLEAYDASGNLLARTTTGQMARGDVETMLLERDQGDIAYVLAFGHMNSTVLLDNLRFGAEASTTTRAGGAYSLPHLPAGSYHVQLVNPGGWIITSSAGMQQSVNLAPGATVAEVDFGLQQQVSNWQNPNNPFDVNNDNVLSPLDALLIINVLNSQGAHTLVGSSTPAPPYVDVNGDGMISPVDALLVINEMNRTTGQSGESPATIQPGTTDESGTASADDPLVAEGDAPHVPPFVLSLPVCCCGCGTGGQAHLDSPEFSPIYPVLVGPSLARASSDRLAARGSGQTEPLRAAESAAQRSVFADWSPWPARPERPASDDPRPMFSPIREEHNRGAGDPLAARHMGSVLYAPRQSHRPHVADLFDDDAALWEALAADVTRAG